MFKFLANVSIPANADILCLLIVGILLQMTDGSPFQIKQKWETVWGTDLPREYFSPIVQQIIKIVLSVIVAVRCGATYPYVVTAMLVIFCMIKDRAPKLILLWIFVAGIKSVFMTFVEALTGVYVCSAFGKIHRACIEFLISKALEIIFAAYLWGSVLGVYQDMERRSENEKILKNPEISYIKKMDLKRQRTRSLLDESTLYKTACLNNFEFKDVPQIILQMLRRADEMSQDSLLGPGMMLASVSNMGSYDNLKRSESLGELGYTNLQTTKVIGLDEEENLSPPEKALRFLKMTWSDVRRIQRSGKSVQTDAYEINSDPWLQMRDGNACTYKPKQARTEVFIRELPEIELDEDFRLIKKHVEKNYNLKLGVSLFNLIKKNDEEDEAFVDSREEETEEEEEEEEEEETEDVEISQIFMSNKKDANPVNRIGLDIGRKGNQGKAYYKLYRKAFMSVIGPEVFDRATKLPKVTSFTFMRSQPEKKKSENDSSTTTSEEYVSDSNSSEKHSPTDEDSENGERITGIASERQEEEEDSPIEEETKIEPTEKPKLKQTEFKTEKLENPCDKASSLTSVKKTKKKRPCYRKRRIRIRWIGKMRDDIECLSTDGSLSNTSDDSSHFHDMSETDSDADSPDGHHGRKTPSNSSTASDKSDDDKTQFREAYFLLELLKKPLPDVLKKYYDLKNRVNTRRRRSAMSPKELEFTNNLYKMYCLKRLKEMYALGGKHVKVWKSKVLKTAEAHRPPITGEFLHKIDHDVMNKLLRYQYLFVLNKMKRLTQKVDSESSKSLNIEEKMVKLGPPKERSHSENLFQNHKTLNSVSKIPSEHSVEVCHRDLTDGEMCNSELLSTINDKELKPTEKAEIFENAENDSLCSQEEDEPISLYYSKAANLASPLLDMKKFIYPDHIHYSYKHVNKKGFDVDISGGLPFLVQSQALTTNDNLRVKEISPKPESEITSRPMDLSFAETNAFADWQNNEQNVSDSSLQLKTRPEKTASKKKKGKSGKKRKSDGENESKIEKQTPNVRFIQKVEIPDEEEREERAPVQISSTQLHSNKGRVSLAYSPALRLEENKKEVKKKEETKEKRAKDMLARLEKEILFQNKNGFH